MKKFSLKLLPEKTDADFSSDDLLAHLTNQLNSYNKESQDIIELVDNHHARVMDLLKTNPEKLKQLDDDFKETNEYHFELITAFSEFKKLSNAILKCREASLSKDINETALSFYLLGIQSSTLKSRSFGVSREKMMSAYKSQQKQIKSLSDKNSTERAFKFFSKSIAQEAWIDSPSIRITTMAEHVLAKLNKKGNEPLNGGKFRDFIPKIGTIKTWIREIAPEQASARGRPSKN